MAIAFRDLLRRLVDAIQPLTAEGNPPGEATQRAIVNKILTELGVTHRDGIFELTAEELRVAAEGSMIEDVPEHVPDWAVREFLFVWVPPKSEGGCTIAFKPYGPWHCGDIEFDG